MVGAEYKIMQLGVLKMFRYNGMDVIKIPLYKKVQARTNKNKRINKKWFKRYGTKIILIRKRSKEILMSRGQIFVPEELWDVFIKAVNHTA